MINEEEFSIEGKRTRNAYLWTRILNTPFWAMYTLMLFVLYKDLHASPLQITVFISLKPMASLFSFYWSSWVQQRSDRLIGNIIWATFLGHIPFLFSPFIDNAWFFVVASGFYIMLYRGVVPAWMEILKLNMPEVNQKKVFAYVNTMMYVGSGLLPILFGKLIDVYSPAWRWIFLLTALVSFVSIFLQMRIPIPANPVAPQPPQQPISIKHLWQPWIDAWKLVKARPDFGRFQLDFILIGGSGLMIIQPALPAFFMDSLNLSFTELAIAISLCKGIGYVLTTPLWTRAMHKIDIFRFSGYVTLMAFLFPLCLIAAKTHLIWVYIAYLLYGVMQAGSELSWHLSGPIFAKQDDSSIYTGVTLASVGLRGCVMPSLGGILYGISGAAPVLLFCGGLFLIATWRLNTENPEFKMKEVGSTD